MNRLTKDGLTGNSGLGVNGFFHISANYAAGPKRCFVVLDSDGWQRMTLARARKEKREIIQCAHCRKPAISIDHLWPYYSTMNYCAKHKGKKL